MDPQDQGRTWGRGVDLAARADRRIEIVGVPVRVLSFPQFDLAGGNEDSHNRGMGGMDSRRFDVGRAGPGVAGRGDFRPFGRLSAYGLGGSSRIRLGYRAADAPPYGAALGIGD